MFKVNGCGEPTTLQAGDEVVIVERAHDTRVGFNRPGVGQLLPDRHIMAADMTALTFSGINVRDTYHVSQALIQALTGLTLKFDHDEQPHPHSDIRRFYVLVKHDR